jgi:putative ubiquitin-RnfH superfamily antitoxin RatB of RatAB toxin-antitoxin module
MMRLHVEVIYALAQRQERVLLDLPPDSTVQDALQASGLPQRLSSRKFGRLGVWGRPVTAETMLRDRDRVEIYRPLIADPKEVRRERAAKSRK